MEQNTSKFVWKSLWKLVKLWRHNGFSLRQSQNLLVPRPHLLPCPRPRRRCEKVGKKGSWKFSTFHMSSPPLLLLYLRWWFTNCPNISFRRCNNSRRKLEYSQQAKRCGNFSNAWIYCDSSNWLFFYRPEISTEDIQGGRNRRQSGHLDILSVGVPCLWRLWSCRLRKGTQILSFWNHFQGISSFYIQIRLFVSHHYSNEGGFSTPISFYWISS